MQSRCSSSVGCSLELRLQLHRVVQRRDVHSWPHLAIRRSSPASVHSAQASFQKRDASVRAW